MRLQKTNIKEWENLHEGDIVEGKIKEIKPYGAFVELQGGMVGLVRIQDLSVSRIKTPQDRVSVGEKIKVKIKDIDIENQKIGLSYKDTLGTWEENVNDIQTGMKLKGIVRETEKNKNGIFIELKPNLVGMAEYEENMEYGKEVDVYIKKIVPEKKKIKLQII